MLRAFDLPVQANQQNLEPMQVDGVLDDADMNEEVVIVQNPTLDLDSYASQYKGYAQIQRLLFIADRSPTLRMEALRMAYEAAKNSTNIYKYREIAFRLLRARRQENDGDLAVQISENDDSALPAVDQNWLSNHQKQINNKTDKLDADLKNYKANSIKESMRRGTDDLGEHYLECGDLNEALKSFAKARDYCTSAKHVVEFCLNVTRVSVYIQHWQHVEHYVAKALSNTEMLEAVNANPVPQIIGCQTDTFTQNTVNKLRCCSGLSELAMRKYKKAAKSFLQTSVCACDFSDIMSHRDIAVYTGLCALATFDRTELAKDIMQQVTFKQFLEFDSSIRDIIQHFYESRYGQCLAMLESIKENLLLDIYLAPHVNILYGQIRKRAWIQYFSPYLSADMNQMASAFNTTVPQVEEEIMQLILDNQIQARIDSHNKIVYAKDVDQRSMTFKKCMEIGGEFEKRTRSLLLRAALIRNGVVVKGPARGSTTLVSNGDGEQASSFS